MPVLSYLANTNAVSDYYGQVTGVRAWFAAHKGEVGLSILTLAEIRRGIEQRPDGKARRALEGQYRYLKQDYHPDGIFVFDEAAAVEWGKLMAEAKGHPLPYDDSLIGAIARSCGLTVATHNWKHFPGCDTVDPWDGTKRPAWQP